MKTTITKKLLGLALSAFSIVAMAQCPSITNLNTTLGSNGTATVVPAFNGTPSPSTSNFYWSTYPNATQTSANGTFQFPANGTYSVCLNYSDSINSCWSSLCTAVTISNMVATSCNASFTAYTDSNCVTHFVNTSTGNNLTYQWYDMSNGFNLMSNSANPITSVLNGTYLISLYSYSNGVFCDSITQAITVNCGSGNNPAPCQASFYSYTDSLCVTHFVNNTSCTYTASSWNINGTAYYTSSPAINLANGNYLATLNVSVLGSGVTATTNTITVACNSGTTSSCQASFYAYTDSLCLTHFINTSVAFGGGNSSQWNINGTYYASPDVTLNLPDGNYYAFLFNYSNGMFCDSAYQYVNVSCNSGTTTPASCQANANFYVFADSTNAGNYFAYNFSSGNGVLSYLWSFGDGTTSTQQYPFHQYAVPGQYVICLTVTSTSGTTTCSDSYCDSSSVQRMAAGFQMSQVNVIPLAVTGIKQAELLTQLNAYPNPIADELTIEATTKDGSKLNYSLIDALGRVVLQGNIENSKAIINTSSLEKGFYSLSITNEKGSSLKAIKLVK
ncbi:MAG: T9SS type A sorting domain-containing protein [Bacteroidia bacterium]|nr:T9SS type A sorting domain-containing protein [Bacteroidia bacterium]